MKVTQRTKKVASSLRRELARLLLFESRNPLFKELVVTRVVVSRDLRVARIYYTNYVRKRNDCKKTEKQLEKATAYLTRNLREKFAMKYFPELRFSYDTEMEEVEKIETILKEIKER